MQVLNKALVLFKTGSNKAFATAVQHAHRISRDRDFFVDFPGINNPAWRVQRAHTLGRVLVMYATEDLADEVKDLVEADGLEGTSCVVADLGDIVQLRESDKGIRVTRRSLRHIGPKAAQKKAERLKAHLEKKGIEPSRPVIPMWGGVIDRNGRAHALCHGQYIDTLLTLQSNSTQGRFTIGVFREPIEEEVLLPSGKRDAYGFGGRLPNLSERLIVSALMQRAVI